MGLISWLKGDDVLSGDETRALPMPDNEIPWRSPYYLTAPEVTPVTALAVADVWAAVRCLCDAASSLPLHVYRRTEAGRERVTSGKLVDLLDKPAPSTSQADLISSLMAHLLIYGGAYLAKFRRQGEVAQLGLLSPEQVTPELEAGTIRFRYDPGSGGQQMLTEADVVYVRGLSMDGVRGLSAVSQAARVIGLSDQLVRHALSYFGYETGGAGDSMGAFRPQPAGLLRVSADMSNEARDRYLEHLRGEAKAHGILVLQGEAEYQQIASNLDDSQFHQQRQLACQEICRVFRIPSHFLNAGTGGDSLTYSTSESMSADFVKYSLTPWLRRIELAISHDRDLTLQRQYVRFSVDALLRADAKTRAEVYHFGLDPVQGWLTREEVRRLEDLEPEPTPPPTQQTIEQMLARPLGVANGREREPGA
jgi:HK97 family phage portal protein